MDLRPFVFGGRRSDSFKELNYQSHVSAGFPVGDAHGLSTGSRTVGEVSRAIRRWMKGACARAAYFAVNNLANGTEILPGKPDVGAKKDRQTAVSRNRFRNGLESNQDFLEDLVLAALASAFFRFR